MTETPIVGHEEVQVGFAVSTQSPAGRIFGGKKYSRALVYAPFGFVDGGNISITETFSRKKIESLKSSGTSQSNARNIDGTITGARGYEFSITGIKLAKSSNANYNWRRGVGLALAQVNTIHDPNPTSVSSANLPQSPTPHTAATSSAATVTAAVQYFHLFRRGQRGATTFDKWLPWCKINEITIRSAVDDFVTMDISGMALDSLATFSGTAATNGTHATAITTDPMMYYDSCVRINGTEATGITGWEFTINHNSEARPVIRKNRAKKPAHIKEGQRDVSVTLTKNLSDTTQFDDLVAETKRTIKIALDDTGIHLSRGHFIFREAELAEDWEWPSAGNSELQTKELPYVATSVGFTNPNAAD